MNAQEFKANYMSEEDYWEVCDPEDSSLPSIEVVYEGDAEVEHKTVYQTSVYKVDGQFFEVTSSRDNCGYWGDGEHYEPEVREVKPVKKVVEITEWVGV